ncbi:MAG: phosphoenolpyruvate synthase [Euryarchaeota archaeon]|nr:phosphoenolpyruvate synthase [Euryarchaeota archaeon]MDE1835151.1 phosphoenolpyruvate synthase [Euryarchaeota archaeon]MDE2046200.1 phosphoenolpyruvate synthase [Thermoplasmata archaeon]
MAVPLVAATALVVDLSEVSDRDHLRVGGKACKLGELVRTGLPIPPGFVVTTASYDAYLRETTVGAVVQKELEGLDPDRADSVEEASSRIRKAFQDTPFPPELEKIVRDTYVAFAKRHKVAYCAVRSSATAEDLADASFAGLQETYLNVSTPDEVLANVRRCWGSLFTPRVMVYRRRKNISHFDVKLAVLVQKMVDSAVSGIMFTADPNTGERHTIVEAGWGLGELIVGGEVTPDHYVVDPAGPRIVLKKISKQSVKLVREDGGGNRRIEVAGPNQEAPKLSDAQILRLTSLGKVIEAHYRRPMDIEWCLEDGELYVVQARPITTGGAAPAKVSKGGAAEPRVMEALAPSKEPHGTGALSKILLRGLGASPGNAEARVRRISGVTDMDQLRPGEVLVTSMTMPDMVPAMSRAAAIVTDEGGMTCHAAIVSRELGVPCVVGTREATKVLRDGQEVTVDGKAGIVYEGFQSGGGPHAAAPAKASVPSGGFIGHHVPATATKIYVNVSIPDKAKEYSELPVQGVGLFRIEFLFTSYVRNHPMALIKEGKGKELVERLAAGIEKVCEAFNPRPVIIRTSDFKTNEYRGMPGGAPYEPEENNPMIGWRGCSRYVSPQYRDAFLLELEAIQHVRSVRGFRNAHVMLPFVRNTQELELIERMMEQKGLIRGPDFKLYLMAEVPSTVFRAREFSEYCDGFSIGSNDLTQLVMGADRDSDILGKMGYFDERDPAVLKAVEMLIQGAHEKGRTVGICGQAPSVYPEFTEFLVRHGIDTISLNADTVVSTTRIVASAEQKILMERARRPT